MDALYAKLYKEYCKLKVEKERELERVNQDQEVKFDDVVSVAENMIKLLKTENASLTGIIDELQNEIVSLRTDKVEQHADFWRCLEEEKQMNRELSAEIEQLQQLLQDRSYSSNRTENQEEQNINNVHRSTSVSRGQTNESMRMTRKRSRTSLEIDPAVNSASAGLHERSTGKNISSDQPKDVSNGYVQPECCQGNIDNEGPCKCLFQNLVECIFDMKISIENQSDGRCMHVVHQPSGYSFKLMWVNKAAPCGELLYHVSSLGTFADVAPKFMREDIIFTWSMCPIFFERVSRVIKHH